MAFSTDDSDRQADWEITPEGLYMATRHLLLRRGYCCANRCRNCPYINWRDNPAWQHAPAAAIQRVAVSPRVLEGVRDQLSKHERELACARANEKSYHQKLIAHYLLLLECWH